MRNKETWKIGNRTKGKFYKLGIWKFGKSEIQKYENTKKWKLGILEKWKQEKRKIRNRKLGNRIKGHLEIWKKPKKLFLNIIIMRILLN